MLPTSSLFRIQHQPALKHANNTNQYFKDSGFKQKYSWCTGSSTSASAVTVLFVKSDHKGNHTLTPEVPQWHSAFEQCEKVSRRNRLTDLRCGDGMWGCVCVIVRCSGMCWIFVERARAFLRVRVRGDCEMIVWCQTNLRLTQRDHVNSRLFQLLDKREQNRRHCPRSALNWAFLYLPCTASYMWLGPPPARSDTGPPFLH